MELQDRKNNLLAKIDSVKTEIIVEYNALVQYIADYTDEDIKAETDYAYHEIELLIDTIENKNVELKQKFEYLFG
ncbi:MAG: hypothetical protein EBY39_03090 [Flavobacteriia bacterium]|nr:hypothetical protein [Flavobacteriia bacterium]